MREIMMRYLALQRARTAATAKNQAKKSENRIWRDTCPRWIQLIFVAFVTPLAILRKRQFTFAQTQSGLLLADHSNNRIASVLSRYGLSLDAKPNEKPSQSERLRACFYLPKLLLSCGPLQLPRKDVSFTQAVDTSRFIAAFMLTAARMSEQDVVAVMVVDDMSNERLALVLAAETQGVPIVYFHMSGWLRPKCPAVPSVIVSASTRQTESYRTENIPILIVPEIAYQPAAREVLYPKPSVYTVGIAVNAWSDPGLVKRLVNEIHELRPRWRFIIRPHPRGRRRGWDELPEYCIVDMTDSLDQLAGKSHFVLTGRTTVAQPLIDIGIPVVYVTNLDHLSTTTRFPEERFGLKVSPPVTEADLAKISYWVDQAERANVASVANSLDPRANRAEELLRGYIQQ